MTTTPEQDPRQRVIDGLAKALSIHGHVFQHTVIGKFRQLYEAPHFPWIVEAAEFPVDIGPGTRIDCILRPGTHRFFLVCECKRVDPALGNWCFVRAPFVSRTAEDNAIYVEHVEPLGAEPFQLVAQGGEIGHTDRLYDLGIEVKSRAKGDGQGGSRDAIEEAAAQVMRGVNGLVNFLQKRTGTIKQELEQGHRADTILMPAIVTTAQLWSSNAKIDEGELATGRIEKAKLTDLMRRDWLFLQYPVGPGIKHSMREREKPREFADVLRMSYLRTIAIIHVDGIEDFFRQFHHYDTRPRRIPWRP